LHSLVRTDAMSVENATMKTKGVFMKMTLTVYTMVSTTTRKDSMQYHTVRVTVVTQDDDPYIQGIEDIKDYLVSRIESHDDYPILVDSIIQEH
jgi:hypothetical protein